MKILPCGEAALLLELSDLADVGAMHAKVLAADPHGVVDLVPAERTLLVTIDTRQRTLTSLREQLLTLHSTRPAQAASPSAGIPPRKIPVRYDGEDLKAVADLLNISVPELITRHQSHTWSVAFTGFAPGFAYLTAPGWTGAVPRLPESRPAVASGSVALAGSYCGIYPRTSPGGWRIIGHTDVPLWDEDLQPPALLPPGSVVEFVEHT